jgi:hypothetical protein
MNRHNGTLLLTLLFLAACATTQSDLPNFREIAPNVAASGQPTVLGFQQLQTKYPNREITILKLNFPEEGSDDGARARGMRVLDLGINPRTDANGVAVVAEVFIVPDGKVWVAIENAIREIPVSDDGKRFWLIHCVHGNDRTGLVVAYALHTVFGWSKTAALREAVRQGYHLGLVGLDLRWLSVP